MMAEDVSKQADDEQADAGQGDSQSRPLWKRLLSVKALVILVVASVLVHGMGLAYSKLFSGPTAVVSDGEVSLGTYRFLAEPEERSSIRSAEFALHIALLDDVVGAARLQLVRRQYRVQQDIEELLRRAHGGDFIDPTLGELKRQLQEQINGTLGIRAIADVIITDLQVQKNPPEPDQKPAAETAESVPWTEKPSG